MATLRRVLALEHEGKAVQEWLADPIRNEAIDLGTLHQYMHAAVRIGQELERELIVRTTSNPPWPDTFCPEEAAVGFQLCARIGNGKAIKEFGTSVNPQQKADVS